MQNLYRASNVSKAMSAATGRRSKLNTPKAETKAFRSQVYAPPLFWGHEVEIYAQFGVIGPNADSHITNVEVNYQSVNGSSPFEIEITGGDDTIQGIGPGTSRVTITGNVATALKMRCKSLSVAQNVIVTSS